MLEGIFVVIIGIENQAGYYPSCVDYDAFGFMLNMI